MKHEIIPYPTENFPGTTICKNCNVLCPDPDRNCDGTLLNSKELERRRLDELFEEIAKGRKK